LAWSVEDPQDRGRSTEVGLRLCAALSWLWGTRGYATEGLRWYEQTVGRSGKEPSKELATCLAGMAVLLLSQGKTDRARELSAEAVTMARSLEHRETIAFALSVLGTAEQQSREGDSARRHLEEAVELYRRGAPSGRMGRALGNLAGIVEMSGDFVRAEELMKESLALFEDLGDSHEATIQAQNLANLLVTSGRTEEAHSLAASLVETVLALRNPHLTMAFSNTFMNILIQLGQPVPAAHLFGAEQAMRERLELPNPDEREELDEAWAAVERLMPIDEWERERLLGQRESLEDLLKDLTPD
jgi:Tetratricopeptide repeat